MRNRAFILIIAATAVLADAVFARDNVAATHQSAYVGQEKRVIKSLSQDDIQQLTNGAGWGLAKAAELNGVPGPRHLLEMQNEIALSKQQKLQIGVLYEQMRNAAIPLGTKLIALEQRLNEGFADRSITETKLQTQLASIATVSQQLRYVHLQAHLAAAEILNESQIDQYNRLRGYTTGDACRNVPAGHDASMWLKHNDCE